MKIHKPASMRFRLFWHSLAKNCVLLLLPLLVLAPYSIVRSVKDNTSALEKNVELALDQFHSTFESIFSHVDNASYFFFSNPRVTLQLNDAFREPKITLDSIKNVTNLSYYFQNLLYTDHYLTNIYVYYKNENHRLYEPIASVIRTMNEEKEQELLRSLEQAPDRDTWAIVPGTSPESSSESLYILRTLYIPYTASASGVLILECNLSRICKDLDSYMQYEGQVYAICDAGHALIHSSTASPELTEAMSEMAAEPGEERSVQHITAGGERCLAITRRSDRQDGFTFLSMIPYSTVYQSSIRLARVYILLTACAILMALMLAMIKTNSEFRYLNTMIDLFANPERAAEIPSSVHPSERDPLQYITYNLAHLFMEQKYMKMQASQRESKLQLLRMQMLQYQINPHFLHNVLNSIYWEAVSLTGSENKCSTMVYQLSSLMRYSLGAPTDEATVKDEFDYIRTYLELMKNRFPDQYRVEFREDVRCESLPIRRMLLQPLVENSIYHGMKERKEPGTIVVGSRMLRRHAAVYVYDDGLGIPRERLDLLMEQLHSEDSISADHVGLANTSFRLVYAFGEDARVRIKSRENRFTLVYFFLPVEGKE